MRSLLTLSIFAVLAACGGSTDAPTGSSPNISPGATGPNDALACTSDGRLTEVAKDSRPALPQIITDGAFAYWSRRSTGSAAENQIVRAPLAGGPVEILVTGAPANALALDETHVYWTESSNDRIGDGRVVARVPKAGGAPEVIVSRESLLRYADGGPSKVELVMTSQIAIDGDALVFGTRADGNGSYYGVFRAAKKAKDAGVRAELVPLTGNERVDVLALAVDATSIYWVTNKSESTPYPDERRLASLRSADKHVRGPAKVIAEGPTFEPKARDIRFGLAQDETNLYWLSQHDGAVMKIAKSGGAPIVLAADERDFTSIALGGGFVYWVWRPYEGYPIGGVRRVSINGGPVTTLTKDIDLLGVAYDPKGLIVTGSALSRVTTCP